MLTHVGACAIGMSARCGEIGGGTAGETRREEEGGTTSVVLEGDVRALLRPIASVERGDERRFGSSQHDAAATLP